MSVLSESGQASWHTWSTNGESLAFGTSSQSADISFSSNATLSIKTFKFEDGIQLETKTSVTSPEKFQSLKFTSEKVLLAGHDNGSISFYSPLAEKLSEIPNAHTGPVKCIDANKFKPNVVATGASQSEVLIWDLNKLPPAQPTAPGPKTQPFVPVSAVAWNCKVEHILANGSGTTGGGASPCVVWDVRKNSPIIKLQDTTGRMQCSSLAWNPEIATQIAVASEDDISPVVQFWDLRMAASPIKQLANFQKGVNNIQFCPFDERLLLSISKDNTLRVFNVQDSSEVYYNELRSNWPFCANWSTNSKLPEMISVSSCDGNFALYSVEGQQGENQIKPSVQNTAISDAFGAFGDSDPLPTPEVVKTKVEAPKIKICPKWQNKSRCSANFGFGGKLITVTNKTSVKISQIPANEILKFRTAELIGALSSSENIINYCHSNSEKNQFWRLLSARLNGRNTLISELGYYSVLENNFIDLRYKFRFFFLFYETENLSHCVV